MRALSLLFCWTCNLAQGRLYYEQRPDGAVVLLKYKTGGARRDFPYEKYPVAFEGRAAILTEIPADVASTIRLLNRGELDESDPAVRDVARPHHQVGGEPYLVQQGLRLKCLRCGNPMPLLAAIADDCLDPRGFAANPFVQVLYHYCPECRIVAAHQTCD